MVITIPPCVPCPKWYVLSSMKLHKECLNSVTIY